MAESTFSTFRKGSFETTGITQQTRVIQGAMFISMFFQGRPGCKATCPGYKTNAGCLVLRGHHDGKSKNVTIIVVGEGCFTPF